jgi:hypothetical protein
VLATTANVISLIEVASSALRILDLLFGGSDWMGRLEFINSPIYILLEAQFLFSVSLSHPPTGRCRRLL